MNSPSGSGRPDQSTGRRTPTTTSERSRPTGSTRGGVRGVGSSPGGSAPGAPAAVASIGRKSSISRAWPGPSGGENRAVHSGRAGVPDQLASIAEGAEADRTTRPGSRARRRLAVSASSTVQRARRRSPAGSTSQSRRPCPTPVGRPGLASPVARRHSSRVVGPRLAEAAVPSRRTRPRAVGKLPRSDSTTPSTRTDAPATALIGIEPVAPLDGDPGGDPGDRQFMVAGGRDDDQGGLSVGGDPHRDGAAVEPRREVPRLAERDRPGPGSPALGLDREPAPDLVTAVDRPDPVLGRGGDEGLSGPARRGLGQGPEPLDVGQAEDDAARLDGRVGGAFVGEDGDDRRLGGGCLGGTGPARDEEDHRAQQAGDDARSRSDRRASLGRSPVPGREGRPERAGEPVGERRQEAAEEALDHVGGRPGGRPPEAPIAARETRPQAIARKRVDRRAGATPARRTTRPAASLR